MSQTKRTEQQRARATGISRRKMIRQTITLGAASALTGCVTKETSRSASPRHSNLITEENHRPGTREWLLTDTRIDPETKYRCPWIEGYCSRTSVRAGEAISIHVSTNPPSPFTLDIYRMGYYGGSGGRLMRSYEPFKGVTQRDAPVGEARASDS